MRYSIYLCLFSCTSGRGEFLFSPPLLLLVQVFVYFVIVFVILHGCWAGSFFSVFFIVICDCDWEFLVFNSLAHLVQKTLILGMINSVSQLFEKFLLSDKEWWQVISFLCFSGRFLRFVDLHGMRRISMSCCCAVLCLGRFVFFSLFFVPNCVAPLYGEGIKYFFGKLQWATTNAKSCAI